MQKNLPLIIRYTVAILLAISLVLFLVKNKDSLSQLQTLDFTYCAILLPPVFFMFLFGSANFFVLLKAKHPELVWSKWLKFHLVKRFMNMQLPQSGNVYEALKMKEHFGINYFSYTSSFGALNWFNACFNCLIALVFTLLLGFRTQEKSIILLQAILLVLSGLVILPLILSSLFRHAATFGLPASVNRYLLKAHELVLSMKRDIMNTRAIPQLVLWNLIFFGNSIVILYCGFKALDLPIAFNVLMPFIVLNSILGLVAILPQNIGIAEYGYGFLGSSFDLSMAAGVLVALLIRLALYVVLLLFWLIFLAIDFIDKRKT